MNLRRKSHFNSNKARIAHELCLQAYGARLRKGAQVPPCGNARRHAAVGYSARFVTRDLVPKWRT